MKKDRDIVTVIGKQNRGKTHFIKNYLLNVVKEPVVIVDTMNEYSEGTVHGNTDNYLQYLIDQEGKEVKGVHTVKCKSRNDSLFLVYLSQKLEKEHTLVLDEADKFCTPHAIFKPLEQLINYGAHWGVTLIFSARRMAKLHKDVTSQSDLIISFSQTEKRDLNALAEYTDFTETVKKLDRRQFFVVGEIRKHFKGLVSDQVLTLNKNNKVVKWTG